MKNFFSSLTAAVVGLLLGLGARLHAALFGYMARQGLVLGAAPMRSTDFRAIVEPILNEAFNGIYTQRKDEYKQIFWEGPGIQRSYHEEPVLYGFGQAPELPDGMPVTYQQGGILFTKRYVYKVFGLAFAITRVLQEDGDAVRIGTTYSRHLAQSLIETKETRTANVLNRAFTVGFNGGDGVTLCNASHPIVNGTFSNLLSTPAALSQTSLEQMIVQISTAVDNNGKKIRLTPGKLVVSPQNRLQAEVLLKSVLRAGTANNDINPVKSMGMLDAEPAFMSRLTSATAWFINTDAPEGLKVLTRRSLSKGSEGDFETDSMRYKATERYIEGWTDPRCIYGTPGV